MTTYFFLKVFLPSIVPLAAGYSVARWSGTSASALRPVLRYVFFPALVYLALSARMPPKLYVTLAGTGAAMAVVGLWLAPLIGQKLKTAVDAEAGVPAIACFSVPFLVLSWGGQASEVRAATILFIGVAVVMLLAEMKTRGFKVLLEEPWLYAAVVAVLYREMGFREPLVLASIRPIGLASYPILMFFLGTALHPFGGLGDKSAWLTVGTRLLSGLAIAMAADWLFDVPRYATVAMLLVALAPPADKTVSLVGSEQANGGRSLVLGTLVSLIAMGILRYNW